MPEFEPPEQVPPGKDAPTPGRPARPEEIPDPERDPLRTPERRRETREPDEEPAEEPEPEEQDAMYAYQQPVYDARAAVALQWEPVRISMSLAMQPVLRGSGYAAGPQS